MFMTYSPQNIVDGLGPIVQIDYLPENYFAHCSASAFLPCIDSLPLTFRTCPGLQTAKSVLSAAWLQARFSLSAGCPRNAQIRDSQKAFLATKKPKRVGQQVGLSFVVLTTVNKEHRLC